MCLQVRYAGKDSLAVLMLGQGVAAVAQTFILGVRLSQQSTHPRPYADNADVVSPLLCRCRRGYPLCGLAPTSAPWPHHLAYIHTLTRHHQHAHMPS